MTQDEILTIENSLDIVLPDEIKNFYKSKDLADISKAVEEFPELRGILVTEPQKLVRLNQRLREHGLQGKPFPPFYFAIGHHHKTNYYFINVMDDNVSVYHVQNSKTWSYDPDNICKNRYTDGSLDFFLDNFLYTFIRRKREKQSAHGSEMAKKQYTSDEIYAFLDNLKS